MIGAVLLLRAEALHDIGLLDERFFLYAAETDWQRRADALGWTSDVCDDVVATHIGAGASLDPMLRETLFHVAHENYIRKWFGTSGWESYRAATVIGSVARAIVLRGPRRSEASSRGYIPPRPRAARCAEGLASAMPSVVDVVLTENYAGVEKDICTTGRVTAARRWGRRGDPGRPERMHDGPDPRSPRSWGVPETSR